MSAPSITAVAQDDPGLAVTLEATAPVTGQGYGGRDIRADWTLDLLERTIFEFRAAGAWDDSRVKFSGFPGSVSCEVLASRGEQAMPWGWRPSDGQPPPNPGVPTRTMDRTLDDVVPAFLGNRVLHGVILLALLALAIVGAVR